MVLKGVNCVHNMIKSDQIVLKGVNWVHNDIMHVKWFWKEPIGYTIIKLALNVVEMSE